MSNYVKAVDYSAKDALASGNPNKIIKGTELNDEFNAIATAVGTKADLASPTFLGNPSAVTQPLGNNSTRLATTAFVQTELNDTQANIAITGGSISGISPPIPVASGGTGVASLDAESVVIGAGTSAVTFVAPGAAGNALVSNGTSWESGEVLTITETSGDAPYYGARAFVTFDGTGGIGASQTILASGNVTSVTKNGVGDYSVTFTTALPSANYALAGTSIFPNPVGATNEGLGGSVGFSGFTPPTTTGCRIWNVWLNESAGAINVVQPADANRISLVFFI